MRGAFFMTWFYFSGCRWILPEIKPLGADWALMELLFPSTSNFLDLQGSSSHNFSMVKFLWKVSGSALNSPAPSPITLFDPEQHFFVAFLRVSATWSLIFVKIKFLDTSIKNQRRELSANHPFQPWADNFSEPRLPISAGRVDWGCSDICPRGLAQHFLLAYAQKRSLHLPEVEI